MNLRGKDALRERLAAEYVLGTLRGQARRRFEGWLHGDAALRATVAAWTDQIGPMGELVPSVKPRAQVWRGIARRIGLREPAPAWQVWRDGALGFWRSLALASSLAAALLLAVVVQEQRAVPEFSDIASLLDEQSRTALLVTADRERGLLTVRVLAAAPLTPQQSLQLWAVPKQGKPRSLGVLGSGKEIALPLTAQALGADVALLAVSLEPKGGSPDPAGPSGPILYKGGWVSLPSS